MDHTIAGIHHITAISGAPQENIDFYAGLLGLRLVKTTVNFDDPGTWHLYYGDEVGHPGTILTFFPWADAVQGRGGSGMATAVSFLVPEGALDAWMERLADDAYDFEAPTTRFDEQVVALRAPDGLPIELVAHARANVGTAWAQGPVPAEHAIRGFHGTVLDVADPDQTARLLTEVFGWSHAGDDGNRMRFEAPSSEVGAFVDVRPVPERGRMGKGTIHHIAFRATDQEEQQAWREAIASRGFNVTPVKDRQYFKSIYFRESGGVLFEIATDDPGFATDESKATLGRELKLPPWLESRRDELEQRLPSITRPDLPTSASAD